MVRRVRLAGALSERGGLLADGASVVVVLRKGLRRGVSGGELSSLRGGGGRRGAGRMAGIAIDCGLRSRAIAWSGLKILVTLMAHFPAGYQDLWFAAVAGRQQPGRPATPAKPSHHRIRRPL